MAEIWKSIEEYDGRYAVSTWGRIKGINGIMKPYTSQKGYLKIGLFKNGKSKKFRVHRLVATAFLPNPDNLPDVHHKDGNKQNNSVTNLEWVDEVIHQKHDLEFVQNIYQQIPWDDPWLRGDK